MGHSYNNRKKEINLINYQIYISIISIIVIIISIILLYNEELYLKKEKALLSPKNAKNFSIFNRSLALCTIVAFLYINYLLYKISKEEGEDLKPYELQISASVLTTIASIIVLYVVLTSKTENIEDIENPII